MSDFVKKVWDDRRGNNFVKNVLDDNKTLAPSNMFGMTVEELTSRGRSSRFQNMFGMTEEGLVPSKNVHDDGGFIPCNTLHKSPTEGKAPIAQLSMH